MPAWLLFSSRWRTSSAEASSVGERDEEVAEAGRGEGGRARVRRDRQHWALEGRRRLHEALLAVREGDEPAIAKEPAGALRPVRVRPAHRFGRLGVIAVQVPEHRRPVVGASHLARELPYLGGEPLVLETPALAEGPGVERDVLLLPEEAAVAPLAEGEVAGGAIPEVLEEPDVAVQSRRRDGAGLGQDRPQGGVPHLGRQQLPDVAGPRAGLAEGAVDEDRGDEVRGQVAPALGEQLRHGGEARRRVADELRLRAQAVKEQAEGAVEAGGDVDLGLAAPGQPLGHDLAAGEDRDDEVPVDPLARPQRGVGHGPEPLPPEGAPPPPLVEGRFRQVVEPGVELGEPEAARHDGGGLVLAGEKLPAERGEMSSLRARLRRIRGAQRSSCAAVFAPCRARRRRRPASRTPRACRKSGHARGQRS